MKTSFSVLVELLVLLLVPFVVNAQDVSWESANGPAGGRVLDIAFNTQGHVFACVEGVGVFRSIDNGMNWTRANSGLTDLAVSALMINSHGHLFIGTRSGNVFRSIDNGESWLLASAGLPNTLISSLVANSQGHIYAGAMRSGIFRSIDNGDSWTPIPSMGDIISIAIKSNGYMYAATFYYGVIRSTDNGESWMSINNGIPKNGYPAHNGLYHWAYDVDVHPNGDIYACAGGGLFRSKDNGDNWTMLKRDWIQTIAFNSLGHTFAGTNGSGIYRSIDDGISWVRVDSGFTSRVINSLAISANDHVFAGSDRIHRSIDNGNNWVLLGGLAYDSYSLIANVNGEIFAGTNGYGIFRTIDEGDTWLQVNSGLTDLKIFTLTTNAKGQVFAGTHSGNLYRSTNSGDSWMHVFTLRERGVVNPSALSFAINPNGHIFVGSSFAGLWRSIDDGDTWTRVFPAGSSYLNSIIINSSGHIFVGTAGYYGGGSIFRSTDDGANWTRVYTTGSFGGIKALMANINSVFAGYEGYAVGSGGVVRSTDNGENWMLVNNGLSGAVYGFANVNEQIFAGTGTVVCQSKDNGDSWMPLLTGWPSSTATRELTISIKSNHDDRLFAATNRGVFRSVNQLGTAVIERKDNVNLNSFILEQNYPNPFNPFTRIRFGMSKAAHVKLEISNLLGQTVKVLVNEHKDVGYHSVEWDASGVASGVYIYRLQITHSTRTRDTLVQSRKMLLLR